LSPDAFRSVSLMGSRVSVHHLEIDSLEQISALTRGRTYCMRAADVMSLYGLCHHECTIEQFLSSLSSSGCRLSGRDVVFPIGWVFSPPPVLKLNFVELHSGVMVCSNSFRELPPRSVYVMTYIDDDGHVYKTCDNTCSGPGVSVLHYPVEWWSSDDPHESGESQFRSAVQGLGDYDVIPSLRSCGGVLVHVVVWHIDRAPPTIDLIPYLRGLDGMNTLDSFILGMLRSHVPRVGLRDPPRDYTRPDFEGHRQFWCQGQLIDWDQSPNALEHASNPFEAYRALPLCDRSQYAMVDVHAL